MTVTIGLAGDTMLGRSVGERLASEPPSALFSSEVVSVAREADLLVLNLECCISERGPRWPDPHKPFFFRAPQRAVEALTLLGVDCVTLANNHALDYGQEALLDTIAHLDRAGIASVGAGSTIDAARAPAVLVRGGFRLAILGFSDHPADFAAGPGQPGIAFADLRHGLPGWIGEAIRAVAADAVLVSPHWGPNMVADPLEDVRLAARQLIEAGATIVAGHSAHVVPRDRGSSPLRASPFGREAADDDPFGLELPPEDAAADLPMGRGGRRPAPWQAEPNDLVIAPGCPAST